MGIGYSQPHITVTAIGSGGQIVSVDPVESGIMNVGVGTNTPYVKENNITEWTISVER